MKEVRIYLQENDAFVDIGNGYLLAIGKKEEVDKADATRIAEMIQEAISWSKWRGINRSSGHIIH